MDALLRDDRLRWDLAQLAATLDQLLPGGLGDRVPVRRRRAARPGRRARPDGRPPGARRARGADRRDRADRATSRTSTATEVADLLGDEAARDLDALDDLAKQLERAGYLDRDGDRLELTPRGSRRIGQKVLDDLFARLRRDAFGGHRVERAGRGGERDETTKPYEFGDPFHLELRRTLANALTPRGERAGPARGSGRAAHARPTSRSSGPSRRRRRRPCCSWT